MFDIDDKIKDVDKVICGNIELIEVQGRGLVSQNILAQTRNLIEYVAIKAYSIDNDITYDWETNKNALEYLKTNNKYLFLRKFHSLIQESKSHYTPDEDGAERLVLKYHEYFIMLKNFVKAEYGISILHNLDKYPLDLDMAVKGYYLQVSATLRKESSQRDLDKARLYVMRSKPVYVDGEMIFENTLIPAGDHVSKFDRFIAFSRMMIADHYAIQAAINLDEIMVGNQRMPVNIIDDFAVSLRPCELNNFAKLFGNDIAIKANHAEYRGLMKYLTVTGCSITDILTSSDKTFLYIKNQVLINAKTSHFFDTLEQARKLIASDKPGANIVRYLTCIMRNKVIKDQYWVNANALLSGLHLKNGCIPFDQMPFASSPVGHNTEMCDVFSAIDDAERNHELLAKRIQTNTTTKGELYTKIKELEQYGDVPALVNKYNNNLYSGHRWVRSIGSFGENYYINGYFEDTKEIINRFRDLSAGGITGYSNSVNYWMFENPELVNSEEKRNILMDMFESTNISLVYGAAGTGKTYLINHVAQFFDDKDKLFLANTNPAVDNLKRKIKAPNCSFFTIARFTKNNSIKHDYDIVIIDECSMVSNEYMRRVLDKAEFKLLILVGDTYQIESITFGNWFGLARYFLEPKTWHELKNPYRAQNPELLQLWEKVRNLDGDITEHLAHYKYTAILDERLFEKAADDEIILCLNYNGLYGINNINRFLQSSNPNPGVQWGIWKYKVGDPILFNETERFSPVLYNNLKGRIVNIQKTEEEIWFQIEIEKSLNEWDVEDTDIDLISTEPNKSVISFYVNAGDEDEDGEGDIYSVVPFQIAYAVSIHKAQGLEYESVKVVITEDMDEMITHNIFYTAITRAKNKLKIFWSPESQQRVLSNFTKSNINGEARIFSAHSGLSMCRNSIAKIK